MKMINSMMAMPFLFTFPSSAQQKFYVHDCLNCLVIEGFDLEPVQKPFLFWSWIIDLEQYFTQLANFETVLHHWFISWAHLCGFLYDNYVSIFGIGHKFSPIAHIPPHYSELPHNGALLQFINIQLIKVIFPFITRHETETWITIKVEQKGKMEIKPHKW